MLKEGGDGGKMGMVAHRGRVRDKLKMWLPKYFKPRGGGGLASDKGRNTRRNRVHTLL